MSSFSFFIFLLCFCFIILSFSPCFYFSLPVRFYPLISFICSWSPSLIRFLTHCRSPFSLALVSNQLKWPPRNLTLLHPLEKPPNKLSKAVSPLHLITHQWPKPCEIACLLCKKGYPQQICLVWWPWRRPLFRYVWFPKLERFFFFANHWSCLSKLGPLLSLQPFMFRRKYFDLFCQWRRNHYW